MFIVRGIIIVVLCWILGVFFYRFIIEWIVRWGLWGCILNFEEYEFFVVFVLRFLNVLGIGFII